MNQIPQNQNSDKQLQRLAAQRELYSAAKKLHVLQILTTVILPIAFAITSLCFKPFSVVAAIFGVIAFVTDASMIEPAIARKKQKAAKIQELFDCDVLELPKSPLKVVDDITVEFVLQQFDAHKKIASNIEKIRNWYSSSVGQLPLHTARILCQRTNCWWDSKLRKNYAFVLRCIGISTFGIILLVGYLTKLSLIEVTFIASGLIPLFKFCIKQSNDNIDASLRLDQLVKFSTNLWEKALKREASHIIINESRQLQDEIYEHRRKSPLILDLYYNVFRDKDEVLMNKASDILIEEALRATN